MPYKYHNRYGNGGMQLFDLEVFLNGFKLIKRRAVPQFQLPNFYFSSNECEAV